MLGTGLIVSAARRPIVRFVLAGTLLALAREALVGPPDEPQRTIAVDATTVRRLAASIDPLRGAPPRAALDASFDAWIDEEVLYREGMRRGLAWNPATIARRLQVGRFLDSTSEASDAATIADVERLGLDRDDAVVRAQVAGRMRLVLQDTARRDEPTDEELTAYLAEHGARFARPARVTFVHVFVARGRGSGARDLVDTIARRLAHDDVGPAGARRLGDAFSAGHRFVAWSGRDVESILGDAVARAVATLPAGRWSEPIASPYGWHLVWIESVRAEQQPSLAAVRGRAREAWRAAHAREKVASLVRALRERYRVRVAPVAAP